MRPYRLALPVCAALIGVSVAAACGDFSSSGAADDAGGDASVGVGGDAAASADALVEGSSSPGCPSGRGPDMVRVGTFCVDSTEVTQEQYLAFTQDKAGDTNGQPASCAWNTTYGAGCGFNPALKPKHPVEAVDWCDAVAFCAWSGKRLCGGANGVGTQKSAMIKQTGTNQWYAACTGGGALAYPYGEYYSATACNGADRTPDGAVPTASLPGCVGGYPGLYDMTGNVFEWVDFCDAQDGGAAQDSCLVMGGNYTQGAVAQRCAYNQPYARDFVYCGFGFRCCADPR